MVTGIAIINRALARARYCAGNQKVKYSNSPGGSRLRQFPPAFSARKDCSGRWRTWWRWRLSPDHHQNGDPAAGADDTEHDVAGNAADHVHHVKQGGGQAEHGAGEPQIFAHGQAGKANVDTVEVGEYEQNKEKTIKRRNSLLMTDC